MNGGENFPIRCNTATEMKAWKDAFDSRLVAFGIKNNGSGENHEGQDIGSSAIATMVQDAGHKSTVSGGKAQMHGGENCLS